MKRLLPRSASTMIKINAKCWLILAGVVAACFLSPLGQDLSRREAIKQEEETDYYRKWLEEDVLYIITDEEAEVFKKLTTPEEKERFIEQFWRRRDRDALEINEFKEEHYRRIAYANEHFHAGVPGWRTDRGKVYIIHGPPDEREVHLAGETYRRQMREGGGSTKTYAFEVWRYRHIDGIGSDVVLEFVDKTMDANYTLALNPEEKDAFLFSPTLGMTLAEEAGMANREDRPYFSPGNRFKYPLMNYHADDGPFQRYELYSKVQRPAKLKYGDLQKLIDVNVTYDNLPVQVRADYFRLNDEQALAAVTLEIENKNLAFKKEGERFVARVAIYGLISGMMNQIESQYEDDLVTSINSLEDISSSKSTYQKIVTLRENRRYKLNLVTKDMNSGKVGTTTIGLFVPSFGLQKISTSSILLSDSVRVLSKVPEDQEMFVLGDVKVRPRLGNEFLWYRPLSIYLELYNVPLDQSSLLPAIRTTYRITSPDGQLIREETDETEQSIHYFSGRRVVLLRELKVDDLTAGLFRVEVEVEDKINDQSIATKNSFRIVDPKPAQALKAK